jgi:hypothetical protein
MKRSHRAIAIGATGCALVLFHRYTDALVSWTCSSSAPYGCYHSRLGNYWTINVTSNGGGGCPETLEPVHAGVTVGGTCGPNTRYTVNSYHQTARANSEGYVQNAASQYVLGSTHSWDDCETGEDSSTYDSGKVCWGS